MQIRVNSEIGKLDAVLVHTPGAEIENMTPATAADVLYDDILNLPLASKEHAQLKGVLETVATVYELKTLLADVLVKETIKEALLREFVKLYRCPEHLDRLLDAPAHELAAQLIEGTPKVALSLERFLDPSPYALPPLPNAFFTRDATMCLNDRVIIGSMAYPARVAESLILKAIFNHHDELIAAGYYFDGTAHTDSDVTIEGGDLLVVREDLVLIGYSERTSVSAIDGLMKSIASQGPVRHFVVVEIPKTRASIHLDMLFTLVDHHRCVVFPPMVNGIHASRAYHCRFDADGCKMLGITEHADVLVALASLGIELEPVWCGGKEHFHQEREQWASGANFFAFGPGQVMGYAHNIHTIESMAEAGFEIVSAHRVVAHEHIIKESDRVLVTMDGAELSRGGGGCRCMTLPLARHDD